MRLIRSGCIKEILVHKWQRGLQTWSTVTIIPSVYIALVSFSLFLGSTSLCSQKQCAVIAQPRRNHCTSNYKELVASLFILNCCWHSEADREATECIKLADESVVIRSSSTGSTKLSTSIAFLLNAAVKLRC